MRKILIIEDDAAIVRLLRFNLEKEGYDVAVAVDGEKGLAEFDRFRPDLVLLDVNLPVRDGFEVCRAISQKSKVPVLIVSARGEEIDRILGLELGAQDYICKPFSVRELLLKVRAHLERAHPTAGPGGVIQAGRLRMDLARYEVRLNDKPVRLSPKEFVLLRVLLQSDGKALSRAEILKRVWEGKSAKIFPRTIDQNVARLRLKLGSEGKRILTVKNVGYRFRLEQD